MATDLIYVVRELQNLTSGLFIIISNPLTGNNEIAKIKSTGKKYITVHLVKDPRTVYKFCRVKYGRTLVKQVSNTYEISSMDLDNLPKPKGTKLWNYSISISK